MTTRAALFALLAFWGVGTSGALPVRADDLPMESARADSGDVGDADLTNRVWVKAGEGDMPGVIRIFLPDGTLVQDSCWETYRLSEWHKVSDGRIGWTEDGMPIEAAITTLSATELVLRLELKGGTVEERYTSAAVPYVCPDMPRT